MKSSLRLTTSLTGLAALLFLGACSKPLTHKLYYQTGRPQALLPTDKEEQAGRAGQLSEIVTYQQRIDTLRKKSSSEAAAPKKDDGVKTISLQGVTITAERPKVKISTLRKGMINLTFLVKVPAAFMDDRYQVVLSPTLNAGDTTFKLPPMVLKGKLFAAAQQKELDKVKAFDESIVDSAKYDSAYFKPAKYRRFMRRLQRSYYKANQREIKSFLSYDRWRSITEQRYLRSNAQSKGAYDTRYHDASLRMLRNAYNAYLAGRDSAAVHTRFNEYYTPEREAKILGLKERSIQPWNTPRRYRSFVERGWTIDSIQVKTLQERDPLDIAVHTYDFKKIAHNESRRKHQAVYHRNILHFPLIPDAHITEEIKPDQDFVYLYSRDIEVTPKMQRRLRVLMESRVTALDRSIWAQRGLDTLSFVISGINDLVDASLIERWSDKPEAAIEYKQGLERMAARDYKAALEIFRKYPDYNAAVAFAGMGDDERALIVLNQLNSTGKVNYLKALCLARSGKVDEAKKSLREAVKLESFLLYKAQSDSVFAPLFADKSYAKELEALSEDLDE